MSTESFMFYGINTRKESLNSLFFWQSESGDRSSDEEDDDEDIDDQYSKNAMLIQGKSDTPNIW